MALVLLDSTVLIDALRGRGAAKRIREMHSAGDVFCTSAINVEEIHRGIFPRETQAVDRLFDGLRVVPVGRAEGERAGAWRRAFARLGRTLTQADCLIAAAAVTVQARLATGNPKDFPMQGIEVVHWPAGA